MKKEKIINIGQRIREAMEDAGYTVAANFAKDMNVSPAAVIQWLKGTNPPSVDNLIDMSLVTNFSLDYILTGYEPDATEAQAKRIRELEEENRKLKSFIKDML